ncbi:MarR family winged helix-turn-helix transcriptional regulator [Microbacterium sp. HJ5]
MDLYVALEALYANVSRELALTPQQAQLLCESERGPSVRELACALHCDRSNITRLVDRATARHLLERRADPADGRIVRIALTDKGKSLAGRFQQLLTARLRGLTRTWDASRRNEAEDLVKILLGQLHRE